MVATWDGCSARCWPASASGTWRRAGLIEVEHLVSRTASEVLAAVPRPTRHRTGPDPARLRRRGAAQPAAGGAGRGAGRGGRVVPAARRRGCRRPRWRRGRPHRTGRRRAVVARAGHRRPGPAHRAAGGAPATGADRSPPVPAGRPDALPAGVVAPPASATPCDSPSRGADRQSGDPPKPSRTPPGGPDCLDSGLWSLRPGAAVAAWITRRVRDSRIPDRFRYRVCGPRRLTSAPLGSTPPLPPRESTMTRRVAVAAALVVLTLLVGSRWVTNRSAVLANERATVPAGPHRLGHAQARRRPPSRRPAPTQVAAPKPPPAKRAGSGPFGSLKLTGRKHGGADLRRRPDRSGHRRCSTSSRRPT